MGETLRDVMWKLKEEGISKMLMEVYYEHYRENCKGAYWEERKSLPYMVSERDKAKLEEFKEILKRKGFQCVAWNDSYMCILVNVELKRFGMINRACKHSCVDDRNYSIDEFKVEILGSTTKKLYAESKEGVRNFMVKNSNEDSVPTISIKARENWSWSKEEAELLTKLGYACEKGTFVEQDYKAALQFYQLAGKAGDNQGLSNLAWMYQNGFGIEKDVQKAIEIYEKSS